MEALEDHVARYRILGVDLQSEMSRSAKGSVLEARRNLFLRNARALNRDLKAGRLTIGQWENRMAREIKDMFVTSYVAGRSGRWQDMQFSDYGALGGMLRKQYQFLRRWKMELHERGIEDISTAKLDDRASLYGQASDQAFERGRLAEVGMNPTILPAHPGDGTTECFTRCKCHWDIQVVNQERRDYDCTWRLGDAEHCRHCLARAASWVGLRVRQNQLVDEPEPIFR